MGNFQGFWSYVHADYQADGGRIIRLARDVADQFEMLTGEKVDLFLDKDAIGWGHDWRNKIDESLASIAFFIPVMTPRYFMSPECRRELQFFARRATSLGVKELVLPLLYVDVPSIHDEAPPDDLVALVQTFQREDWQPLRFVDVTSEGYRKGVARLAGRLVEANKRAELPRVTSSLLETDRAATKDSEQEPGFLDRLATAEETLPQWLETLQGLGRDIVLIGQVMAEAGADMRRGDAQGRGFAARLVIARRVAQRLGEPTERIWSFGNEFARQLHAVDEGFRAIIDRIPEEIRANPSSKTAACKFFDTVRQLSASAHDGLDAVQRMIDAIAPIEALSRDLRPPLRRLKQGLTIMVEAREVTDEWIHLIDGSGVMCAETNAPDAA